MKYNEFHLERQYSNCMAIWTAESPEMTNDIFARALMSFGFQARLLGIQMSPSQKL
jgi:hypothetical protein